MSLQGIEELLNKFKSIVIKPVSSGSSYGVQILRSAKDAEKVIKTTKSKEFLRGSHDVSTIFGVAYGILKPDDPDPILKEARKIESETKIMMAFLPESSENSRLAGAVGFLTLFPHIKKKYL